MARETTHRDQSGRAARRGQADLVPSRRQYLDLKSQHPRAILLYQMGDFYETFDEDARIVARDARITLTSRGFGRGGRVPMAGIPCHALNHYLGRLLAANHTIAIAEQLSEPGRGLVERAVTRVLTPGTVAESALLPSGENRYLAAVHARGERLGLSWVDVSTGEFAVMELGGPEASARLAEELARLSPSECLVPDDLDGQEREIPTAGHRTRVERWHFAPERARDALCRHFGTRALDAYGCGDLEAATGAAGAILAYLTRANPALLPLLTGLRTETAERHVGLDPATRRNLELTGSLRTRGTRGSLLGVLDETRTAMGARALRRMVGQPLRDLAEIRRRQSVVAALVERPAERAGLGETLAAIGDLERLTGRVSQGSASARDFLTLAAALRSLPWLIGCLGESGAPALSELAATIDDCADLLTAIEAAIDESDEGEARVRPGCDPALDAVQREADELRRWLVGLERRERERTGIRSLKVGFNKVFGYYIEVTRPNLPLVPADYARKQTVATGERYITAPLKEAEARLLAIDERVATLEREALARLGACVTAQAGRILAGARRLAELDALRSLAEVADRGGWVAPDLDESDSLAISAGRHPVVEESLSGDAFIPNDCRLGGADPRLLLVTGPNMGGKSTYLRQVAVITLLAQIGSFVPAERARIGLVDRIFTRVGARDDLAGGASTFMVEMVETATILHQATPSSLIVLDEVGRGTSTDDGIAIARAVLEDIQGRIGARALFATHYRELTALASHLPGVANVHVAVAEAGGRVVFLYAVRPGPADRAYGIQVARLAGLPPWVADRAETILRQREREAPATPPVEAIHPAEPNGGAPLTHHVAEDGQPIYQIPLDGFPTGPDLPRQIARELRQLALDQITPGQAIDWLIRRQARLRGGQTE